MIDQSRLLFIHGLMGSSQGFKANLLRQLFPEMIIPDFPGQFPDRMDQLRELIGAADGWTIIGSSLGGLMATWFVLESPKQVDRLILLAPALPYVLVVLNWPSRRPGSLSMKLHTTTELNAPALRITSPGGSYLQEKPTSWMKLPYLLCLPSLI